MTWLYTLKTVGSGPALRSLLQRFIWLRLKPRSKRRRILLLILVTNVPEAQVPFLAILLAFDVLDVRAQVAPVLADLTPRP